MKSVIVLFMMIVNLVNCDKSLDIEKAFIDNEIIPDVLKIAPNKILNVTYPGEIVVNLGNELKATQTKDAPKVSWAAEKGAYYTLMKVDPDAPSRADPKFREFRHWLVMNILEFDVENGDEICQYIGVGAPNGTSFHRYIFLVYKQPNGVIQHNEARATNKMIANRPMSSALEYAQKYNLGDPEFGNFYQAQWDEYSDVLLAQLQ